MGWVLCVSGLQSERASGAERWRQSRRFPGAAAGIPTTVSAGLWGVFKILASDKVGELVDLWDCHLNHLYYFNGFGFDLFCLSLSSGKRKTGSLKHFHKCGFSVFSGIFSFCPKEQSCGLNLKDSGVTFQWIGDSSLNILQYNVDAFHKKLHLISYSFSHYWKTRYDYIINEIPGCCAHSLFFDSIKVHIMMLGVAEQCY